MIYSRLSAVFFLLSGLAIVFILYNIRLPWLSMGPIFWGGFVALGILGFTFGLLSTIYDKKKKHKNYNPVKGILRYAGMFTIFTGFIFKIQYWPYSDTILFSGVGITVISFFLKAKNPQTEDSDILDDHLS